jgi:cytoskeleton protein RodZ
MALSELGAYLQRHREERGWTLEDVEAVTHIRRPYLEALEQGDWDNLPPSVYTRGLLRNYARGLGVSQASIMRMYAKERPQEARLPEPQLISQPLVVSPRFNFELIAAVALLTISVVLIGWVIRSQLPGATAQTTGGVPPAAGTAGAVPRTVTPTARAATTSRTPPPTLGPRQTAAVVADDRTTPGTPGPGTAPGTPTSASTPGPGTAPGTPTSATTPGTATAGTPRTAGTPLPSGTPVGNRPGGSPTATSARAVGATATRTPAGDKLVMDTVATSDAWVQVYADGALVFRGFLRQGESKRWAAGERITLRTGNAGGTEVKLNGEAIPPLGGKGEVVEFEWRLLPSGDVEQRQL